MFLLVCTEHWLVMKRSLQMHADDVHTCTCCRCVSAALSHCCCIAGLPLPLPLSLVPHSIQPLTAPPFPYITESLLLSVSSLPPSTLPVHFPGVFFSLLSLPHSVHPLPSHTLPFPCEIPHRSPSQPVWECRCWRRCHCTNGLEGLDIKTDFGWHFSRLAPDLQAHSKITVPPRNLLTTNQACSQGVKRNHPQNLLRDPLS